MRRFIMPNWCSNYVTITAPAKQVFDNFMQHMEAHWSWNPNEMDEYKASDEPAGFCSYFLPEPEYEVKEAADPKQFVMPDWWNFRVENWGTKWEVSFDKQDCDIDEEELSIRFFFDSAWSPPVGVYEAAVDQGWKVDATYCEPGMAFIGFFDTDWGDNTYELGDRRTTDAPEWLVDAYECEYDNIDECLREEDLEEEMSRADFLAKWGEEFISEWDNYHQVSATA